MAQYISSNVAANTLFKTTLFPIPNEYLSPLRKVINAKNYGSHVFIWECHSTLGRKLSFRCFPNNRDGKMTHWISKMVYIGENSCGLWGAGGFVDL